LLKRTGYKGGKKDILAATMNHFTIRDIENLCRIKAHTLRVWEQRYGLCVAKRKQSQHRIYDNEDLKQLLRVSFLYHNGHKISSIAALDSEAIEKLVQEACVNDKNKEVYIFRLMEAAVTFNQSSFEKLVDGVIAKFGFEKTMIEVLFPFLERIGLLWLTNNIVPAQEHFSSLIIRNKIICAIDELPGNESPVSTVIVFAPKGEFHEIPLLVINYLFRKHQHHTYYFGVNTSVDTLKEFMLHKKADAMYMHVITHFQSCGLQQYLEQLGGAFPGMPIYYSGAACWCVEKKPANLHHVNSIEALVQLTRNETFISA
jgi:DNA-binding transcriptional MerR regulator